MKKNLYIANLLVAGLMTFTGCTDGFESDNANKAGYTPELQEYDLQKYVLNLGVMQQGIYFNYDWGKGTDWTFQTIQNLGHDMFAGYFHDMNNSFNDKNSVYALNDGWTGSAWTYTYGYIMTAAQKSEKINQEQKGLLSDFRRRTHPGGYSLGIGFIGKTPHQSYLFHGRRQYTQAPG